MFCAVFSYEVADAAAFERAYGPDGEWARFFRGAAGYLGTELLRSEGRHLVIDRWASREAHTEFLASHRDEYARRSAEAERLYVREERLGEFEGTPGPTCKLRLLPGRFTICTSRPTRPLPRSTGR